MSIQAKIKILYESLNNLSDQVVVQKSDAFFDEPPYFFYSGLVRNTKVAEFRAAGYQVASSDIVAGGCSFNNPSLALLKCLAELIERFSMFIFLENNIKILDLKEMQNKLYVDPHSYNSNIKGSMYGWIKAEELTSGLPAYVPAQLVFLNYYSWAKTKFNENQFVQHISNGGAFGFTKEDAIINGIYELIERDSILTNFFTNYQMPRIDPYSTHSKPIKEFLTLARQYNFESVILEATNDLKIPTFTVLMLDLSGGLPKMTAGAKSSLNATEAILGSLEESIMGRTWIRHELLLRKNKIPRIVANKIRTRLERGFYYANPNNVSKLDYLINQPHRKLHSCNTLINKSKQLDTILSIFKKKKIHVFAVDIKPAFLDLPTAHVYKIIIPQLQYLYLDETKYRTLNLSRLKAVYNYHGQTKEMLINHIPHFLL